MFKINPTNLKISLLVYITFRGIIKVYINLYDLIWLLPLVIFFSTILIKYIKANIEGSPITKSSSFILGFGLIIIN